MNKRGCLVSLILLAVITIPPCLYVFFGCFPAVLAEITGTKKRGYPDLDLGLAIPFFVVAFGWLLSVAGLWRLYFRSNK